MEPNVPYLCYTLAASFEELAGVLSKEMEAKAFTTSDYDTLRVEYAYLNRLVQHIKNEAATFEQ